MKHWNGNDAFSDEATRSASLVMRVADEVMQFERTFPRAFEPEDVLGGLSWRQLERQLQDLAANAHLVAFVPEFLRGVRKTAGLRPSEMVLREILVFAAIIMDHRLQCDGEA